jgi:signal transduction histidine kinase
LGRDRGLLARLSLGRGLRLALVGLTLALGTIAAVAIGNLYDARQRYERTLAGSYAVETAASRLVAASVVEEAAIRQDAPPDRRRRTRRAFARQAAAAADAARGDPRALAALRDVVRAQRAIRRGGDSDVTAAADRLAGTQAGRRAEARVDADDDSERAIAIAAVAGGLALLAALALVGVLVGSIRRPLDDLVSATGRLAAGDLEERVRPGGPAELSELGTAFNAMADSLDEARRRVEVEREKLATTIESLGDGLVVCDREGTVTAVNPRAEELVPDLRPGTSALDSLPPLEQALGGEVVRESGGRTLSITAALLGEGGGVVWTVRDVSERARLERVKSDFVATASHELRAPLSSIKGFVELLDRSDELGARDREAVEVIRRSADRLVELVNDLLDVARLEAGALEVRARPFELGQVAEEVAASLRERFDSKGQRLEVHVPAGLPRAVADPARVRQIALHLLSNAHQYTDDGGQVTVSIAHDEASGSMALTVADTGHGMTAEELERAFDRFARGGEDTRGSGLGLAIVKSLAELQGGSVTADSTPGEGSAFTVRIPAERAREALRA